MPLRFSVTSGALRALPARPLSCAFSTPPAYRFVAHHFLPAPWVLLCLLRLPSVHPLTSCRPPGVPPCPSVLLWGFAPYSFGVPCRTLPPPPPAMLLQELVLPSLPRGCDNPHLQVLALLDHPQPCPLFSPPPGLLSRPPASLAPDPWPRTCDLMGPAASLFAPAPFFNLVTRHCPAFAPPTFLTACQLVASSSSPLLTLPPSAASCPCLACHLLLLPSSRIAD